MGWPMRWVPVVAVILLVGCNTLLAWQLRKSEDLAQTAIAQTKQAITQTKEAQAQFDSLYVSFKSLSGAFNRLDVACQHQRDILTAPQDRFGVPTWVNP